MLPALLVLASSSSVDLSSQPTRSICVSFSEGSSSSSDGSCAIVELRSAISHNPCVQGRPTSVTYRGTTYSYPNGTFGVDCKGNSMWAIGGCRGRFGCANATTTFDCSSESYTEREYCELAAADGCPVPPAPPPTPPVPPVPPGPELPPLPAGMQTQLLIDSRNVIATTGSARLVLGPVEKDPANPVIKEDKPWEMRFDNMQPSVWYDSAAAGWRCWYNSFSRCGPKGYEHTHDCQRGPSDCTMAALPTSKSLRLSAAASAQERTGLGSSGRQGVMCTATSSNGSVWVKPNLGLVKWGATPENASTDNNIILDFGNLSIAGSPGSQGTNPWGIYLDERVGGEGSERWKAFGMLGEMQMVTSVSADGLTWRTREIQGTQGKFDTHANVIWDAATRKWVGHARCNPTAGTHGHSEGGSHHTRVQCYTESSGAEYATTNWSVFVPSGLNSSNNAQPDALTVFRYAGIYLGFANVFNPFLDTASDHAAPLPGNVNMELAWSTDARRWRYAAPGQSFVPHAPGGGAWDCCGVFGAKQSPEDTPEFTSGKRSLPVFYAGCNGRL